VTVSYTHHPAVGRAVWNTVTHRRASNSTRTSTSTSAATPGTATKRAAEFVECPVPNSTLSFWGYCIPCVLGRYAAALATQDRRGVGRHTKAYPPAPPGVLTSVAMETLNVPPATATTRFLAPMPLVRAVQYVTPIPSAATLRRARVHRPTRRCHERLSEFYVRPQTPRLRYHRPRTRTPVHSTSFSQGRSCRSSDTEEPNPLRLEADWTELIRPESRLPPRPTC